MKKPNQNNGLTAQQRIERAFVWSMSNPNFVAMSGVMMVGPTTVVSDANWKAGPMKSAYTDGYRVVFHEDFVASLTDQELRFALLHENYHKAFRHMSTWINLFKENPVLATIACDARINADILSHNDPGVAIGKDWIFDKKYEDPMKWDSYHIFQDLKKNGLPQSMKCNGNCKQGDGSGQPGGQCTCQGFDEHGWEEAEGMSDAEKREAEQAIDSAIRQGAILASKMGNTVNRSLEELMKITIDYKQILREFITSRCRGRDESSWRRPSRRHVADDVYMPSQVSESMEEIVLACDTSGSIDGQQLTYFLSNVMRILDTVKPDKVHLIYWDSSLAGHEVYLPDQYASLPTSTVPRGGGGTTVSVVSDYLNKNKMKPQCIVILTDGYLGDGYGSNWPAPVLWAVKGDENFTAPYGTVLILPDDLR